MISSIRLEVVEAAKDYKYLLNRGYGQKMALDTVTSRYGLASVERTLLLRCVHSDLDSATIRRKHVNGVTSSQLVIDGYNVFLTIHAVTEGMNVFLCDDGFVRDLRKSYRKGVTLNHLELVVEVVNHALTELSPASVKVVLDKNVSYSARHADRLRYLVKGVVDVVLAEKADIELIGGGGVIASSDYVVVSRVSKVFDLAGYIVKTSYKDRLVDLASLIET